MSTAISVSPSSANPTASGMIIRDKVLAILQDPDFIPVAIFVTVGLSAAILLSLYLSAFDDPAALFTTLS